MADLDLLNTYLKEISEFPVLTKDQEAILVNELRAGSAYAKEVLIKTNLRLVVTIARQFANSGLELYDLIQEGNLGLVEAADDYISKVGTNFRSYADDCMRNQIISAIRRKPKHHALSFDMDDGLSDTTPDKKTAGPEDTAESIETTDEVRAVLNMLPNSYSVSKVANGYGIEELSKEERKDYSKSLRLLSHPARSSNLDQF